MRVSSFMESVLVTLNGNDDDENNIHIMNFNGQNISYISPSSCWLDTKASRSAVVT